MSLFLRMKVTWECLLLQVWPRRAWWPAWFFMQGTGKHLTQRAEGRDNGERKQSAIYPTESCQFNTMGIPVLFKNSSRSTDCKLKCVRAWERARSTHCVPLPFSLYTIGFVLLAGAEEASPGFHLSWEQMPSAGRCRIGVGRQIVSSLA